MFKSVFSGVIRHGREVWEGILQKGQVARPTQKTQDVARFETPQSARPAFVKGSSSGQPQGILARYLARDARASLAAELRRRFGCQLQSGSAHLYGSYRGLAQKLSLYAFVGIGMANTGKHHSWVHLEDGFDSVCEEIKGRMQDKLPPNHSPCEYIDGFHGDKGADYEFGPMIAKGCNAAVYQAKLRSAEADASSVSSQPLSNEEVEEEEDSDFEVVEETPMSSLGHAVGQADINGDLLAFDSYTDADNDSDIEVLGGDVEPESVNLNMFNALLAESDESTNRRPPSHTGVENRFDLAVKIMFNYDAESCAAAILKSMNRELIPAQNEGLHGERSIWENGTHAKMKASVPERLPPHPNIVNMWGAFVDNMPDLPEGWTEYPNALPPRLNHDGFGRNKTMFVVMKRYQQTLREYIQTQSSAPTLGQSVLLLTQLVEAVVHLGGYSLAHRDIKSDNVLLDSQGDLCPHLVVSDFGCCLDGRRSTLGLRVPYLTEETGKGGNGSLMAPEISAATPGPFRVLDFRKSDLWAAGTLSYEIFGADNPFYRCSDGTRLESATYKDEDLPPLPEHVGHHLQGIVHSMLHRNPAQRPDAIKVANMLQILLWAPQDWVMTLLSGFRSSPPCKVKVMRWLLQLFAEVTFEKLGQRSGTPEHQLKSLFLARVDLDCVMDAFDSLWSY